MNATGSLYTGLLLTALVGSLGHCLGMCGPLVLILGAQIRRQGSRPLPAHLLYHGSRIAVYAVLGAIVGGLGSLIGIKPSLGRLAGTVSFVLGLAVVGLGLGYLGWLPLRKLEGATGWWSRAVSGAMKRRGAGRVAMLGALNGILPCALVYSGLLVAASTGGAVQGAVGMVVFGAGTLPAMLVVGLGAGALSVRVRQVLARISGVVIVLVGCQLVMRGLAGFGVVPMLRVGRLMIW
jgi:uncharacterized protein